MSKKNKRYDSFVTKVGIGFDSVLDTIELVDENTSYDDLSKIPPYNIKKTNEVDYYVELSVPGAKKEAIKATVDVDSLTVSATVDAPVDPEGDDLYFHKGIFQGGKFEAKFALAKNLQFKSADLVDGVLTIKFVDSNIKRATTILPIGPFPAKEEDKDYKIEFNSAGQPVMILVSDTVESATTVIPVVIPSVEPATEPVKEEVKAEEAPASEGTVTVTVNEDNTNVPTTEVVLPDPLPQIVEVSIDLVGNSTTSSEPQATITVEDATHEVSDNTVLETIKTPEGQPDIVVSVPAEVAATAEANGIDIVSDVKAAVEEAAPEIVAAPIAPETTVSSEPVVVKDEETSEPKIEVVVPEELPPVVELVKSEEPASTDSPVVELVPADPTNIPEDHVLVPVVTQEGQNDVVVAVAPELHEELTNAGVDIAADVSTAVIEAAPEVPVVPETVTEVVNADVKTEPTVEVTLPVELPQIVEAKVDEVPAVVDTKSEEPQVSVEVKDATAELPDNVVTDVIKTEDGKADVVVAIDADTHAELLDKGVDVIEAVKAAVEQSEEVKAPDLPPATEEVPTTDVVVAPSDGHVDAEPVTVTVPDVVPQVVEATVNKDNTVILSDSSASIPEEATVTPVVTQEGQPDIVVVTTPETDKKLDDLGVDVAKDVSAAVIAAEPEVVTPSDTPADVVEAAAPETTTVVTNDDSTKEATVAVNVPVEVPQIVEVKLDEVAPTVDVKSEEPQVTVTLTDATHEVSDNVTLETVKTPDNKADVVVAIPTEVQAALDEKKIDIMPAIEAAVNSEEVKLPDVPVVTETPKTEEVTVVEADAKAKVDEVSVIVPETVTPVMEAKIETADDLGTTVKLVPTDSAIPADAELVPVVTPAGENDIVVAVPEEVKTAIEAGSVTVSDALSEAVNTAAVSVVDSSVIDTTEQSPL
jgi:HSP20 family molecular chaperone IbpA